MSNVQISEAAKLAVETNKQKGIEVHFAKVAGKEYLFKPINRAEWKILLKKRNEAMQQAGDDELKKAEVLEQELESLLSIALLYSADPIENVPAGAVQSICDAIMVESGFTGLESEPIKL